MVELHCAVTLGCGIELRSCGCGIGRWNCGGGIAAVALRCGIAAVALRLWNCGCGIAAVALGGGIGLRNCSSPAQSGPLHVTYAGFVAWGRPSHLNLDGT